ncbi:MAG TPA: NUDIX domain-containing protein [Microlunatus sp.]
MDVRGVDAGGGERFTVPLPHGRDPAVTAHDLGFVLEQPLDAFRDAAGELVLRFLVRPVVGETRPSQRPAGRDIGLLISADEEPITRQRIAAYAIVLSRRGLLATQYSSRTAVDGRWGMPGGGIDPGEDPGATVVREVHEETAQVVELGPLEAVQTSHWVGRNPSGQVEDFHAVRLVYRATCPEPGDPVVLDVGGTTADACWVPLESWRSRAWTVNWREALDELLPR